jgi:hypothetical protein
MGAAAEAGGVGSLSAVVALVVREPLRPTQGRLTTSGDKSGYGLARRWMGPRRSTM